jgi:hypothetical protein
MPDDINRKISIKPLQTTCCPIAVNTNSFLKHYPQYTRDFHELISAKKWKIIQCLIHSCCVTCTVYSILPIMQNCDQSSSLHFAEKEIALWFVDAILCVSLRFRRQKMMEITNWWPKLYRHVHQYSVNEYRYVYRKWSKNQLLSFHCPQHTDLILFISATHHHHRRRHVKWCGQTSLRCGWAWKCQEISFPTRF